eukprot:451810_1
MKAFRLQLEGNTPGNIQLNQDKVMQWSGNNLYSELDAEISINRAFTFSKIIKSLSDEQLFAFYEMDYTNGFQCKKLINSINSINENLIMYLRCMHGLLVISHLTHIFCPERQANYFGSF